MKKVPKIIFITSLTFLSLVILKAIFGHYIPLEFTNDQEELIFDEIRFWGFPIAILLTLFGTIRPKDEAGLIIAKVVLTLMVLGISFFIMVMSIFAGMCRWSNEKELFQKINDPDTKIVLRDYGCGALDSSPATHKVFKIKHITFHFIWVTPIDTTKVDKRDWKPIVKEKSKTD
jgi:hypothetical protein